MIGLITAEDIQELYKELEMLKGRLAEQETKFSELVKELNSKIPPKAIPKR